MSIKNDRWIREMAAKGMIDPFIGEQISIKGELFEIAGDALRPPDTAYLTSPVISYGLSSYGYDFRIAPEWKLFTNTYNTIVDPKNFQDSAFVELKQDHVIIPPNSFVLGRSVEYWKIPRNILAICLGKSTYARIGLSLNVTPLEPEFEGQITIEISNTTPLPAKVYANEGIGQMIFLESDEPCEVSYADRKGKYQGQVGVVPARIK